MALVRVKPTEADVAIANSIAAHTGRPAEHIAQTMTWGADEHVLCALAIGWLTASDRMQLFTPGLFAEDGEVTNDNAAQFLRNFMAEFHTFIARVRSVLPKDA